MKKVYFVISSLVIMLLAVACNSNDKTANPQEESSTEQSASETGEDVNAGDAASTPKVADKSTINVNDIDPKDTSFTSRTKALYRSDETGKAMAVVFGMKSNNNGIAIIEKEGEKPITLKQSKPLSADGVEFTNGTVTLTRSNSGVKITESGEETNYVGALPQ